MVFIVAWFVLGALGALLMGKVFVFNRSELTVSDLSGCVAALILGPIGALIGLFAWCSLVGEDIVVWKEKK